MAGYSPFHFKRLPKDGRLAVKVFQVNAQYVQSSDRFPKNDEALWFVGKNTFYFLVKRPWLLHRSVGGLHCIHWASTNLLVCLGGQHHICITSYDIMCTYDIYVYIYIHIMFFIIITIIITVFTTIMLLLLVCFICLYLLFLYLYIHTLSLYIHILCVYIYIDTSNVSRLETSQSSPRPFFSRRVSRWSNRISGVMLRRRARRAGHVVDVGDTTTGCLWSVYIYIYIPSGYLT